MMDTYKEDLFVEKTIQRFLTRLLHLYFIPAQRISNIDEKCSKKTAQNHN